MDFVTLVRCTTIYMKTRAAWTTSRRSCRARQLRAERLASGQPLRVAGIAAEGQEAPAVIRIMNELDRALVEEMARR